MDTVSKLFQWYLKNQEQLVSEYNGRVLLISGDGDVKAFNDDDEAFSYANAHFRPGTFIIQKCTPGRSAYSQTFHSRVIFS